MDGFSMTTEEIVWGLLFGSIGYGYFVYGKKRKLPVPIGCGVALMVYPYFVTDTVAMVAIGAVLSVVPFFLMRKWAY
jgi:hypothetical protein